ncbi:MAG: ParB N-terminal domain-containing protein [Thermodesulfobacteriota bacterium]
MTGWLNRIKSFLKRPGPADEVKSFREDQEKEAAFDSVVRGLRMVHLDRIVGSLGRYHDFDRSFRPKQHLRQDRMKNVRRAIENGKVLPPVILYKIKDEYYVVDGNHRVAAAKELGFQEIEARIIEFISSKRTLENILYYEKLDFEEKAALPEEIVLTEIGQYKYLFGQIERHGEFLGRAAGQTVAFREAAADWHRTIYRPLKAIVSRARLIDHFPRRTVDDLCTYISVHQWERPDLDRHYGVGINQLVPRSMEEFRSMMSNRQESDYPEMVREITAFVLMNVTGKKEDRVVEKLFELEEVKEVHSVHGSVDIIAKITLKRTLLMSDAETIGEFVRLKIRMMPGVISTQTLIPSMSRIKGNGQA